MITYYSMAISCDKRATLSKFWVFVASYSFSLHRHCTHSQVCEFDCIVCVKRLCLGRTEREVFHEPFDYLCYISAISFLRGLLESNFVFKGSNNLKLCFGMYISLGYIKILPPCHLWFTAVSEFCCSLLFIIAICMHALLCMYGHVGRLSVSTLCSCS